jgi:4-hydroxy-4-methyl-2-oxoglutarate aldolase
METYFTRLSRLDCCAVSDALDQLGLTPSVTGLTCQTTPKRICGKVVTVRLAAGKAPEGAPVRHLCTTAIELAEKGDVIVVEQRTGIEAAGWGGILSTAALTKGASGIIMEGLARDNDESDQLGFTVYARGATARTARGRIHEAETGGLITVGDTSVASGDWVVADRSGTAFIPADSIEAVLSAAERIVSREAAMAKSVLAGTPATEAMGANYEHLLEKKDNE